MSAGRYDIMIEQGATFTLPISYKDSSDAVINLATTTNNNPDYTARMKIKESAGGTIIASSESSDAPKNTLSIALAASGNNITVTMSATNTAALDFETAIYDLELVSGASVDRIIEGRVKLSREVTS